MKNQPSATSSETSIYTAFRCPPDVLAAVKIAAKKDWRSVSSYIVATLATATGV